MNKNTHKTRFEPTFEQSTAASYFDERCSMKISAYAGAGKTSTLKLLSTRAGGRKGLYLAFNKSIAAEAQIAFGAAVQCATTHSLALRTVRAKFPFGKEKLFDRISPRQLAAAWELQNHQIGSLQLDPGMIAFLVLKTVTRFCQSGDPKLTNQHVQLVGRVLGHSQYATESLIQHIVSLSLRLWESMISPESDVPLGHDGYLKLYSLMKPVLPFDYVMLDEAQDTNPAVLAILNHQAAQMVYVGDTHQSIYQFRGSEDAMSTISTDVETSLTKSFRFGPDLAAQASTVLAALGAKERIVGNEAIDTALYASGTAHAIVARTNVYVFREMIDVLEREQTAHIVGGTSELKTLLRDVYGLMSGRPGTLPEFFGCNDWREVQEFAEEPEGEVIRPLVSLVNQVGTYKLRLAVESSKPSESGCDHVISTAHKSKGREWESVRLCDDFSNTADETGAIPASEARLYYVAMTRAKKKLIVDPTMTYNYGRLFWPKKQRQSA